MNGHRTPTRRTCGSLSGDRQVLPQNPNKCRDVCIGKIVFIKTSSQQRQDLLSLSLCFHSVCRLLRSDHFFGVILNGFDVPLNHLRRQSPGRPFLCRLIDCQEKFMQPFTMRPVRVRCGGIGYDKTRGESIHEEGHQEGQHDFNCIPSTARRGHAYNRAANSLSAQMPLFGRPCPKVGCAHTVPSYHLGEPILAGQCAART